jgi:hypothetical protein
MNKMVDLGKGIQAGIVNITPEQAAKMLERSVKNRKLSIGRVHHYANEMREGNWMLNGDSIRFDFNGVLTDGQHRLHAIIKANVSVEMIAITGLNPEVFKNIDTGKNRSGGDVISIITDKTNQHASFASSLITKILEYQKRNTFDTFAKKGITKIFSNKAVNSSITNDHIVEYYRNNKTEVDEVVSFCLHYEKKSRKILSLGPLIFIFWRLRKINILEAERFFISLVTGENLSGINPIYHLREKLMAIKASETKPPTWHYPALIYKAWNAFRRNQEMKVLVIRSNETEPVKPI